MKKLSLDEKYLISEQINIEIKNLSAEIWKFYSGLQDKF